MTIKLEGTQRRRQNAVLMNCRWFLLPAPQPSAQPPAPQLTGVLVLSVTRLRWRSKDRDTGCSRVSFSGSNAAAQSCNVSYGSLEGCHMPMAVSSRNTSSYVAFWVAASQDTSTTTPGPLHPLPSLPPTGPTARARTPRVTEQRKQNPSGCSKKSPSIFTRANFKRTSRLLLATSQGNVKLSSSKPREQISQLTANAICCSYAAVTAGLKVTRVHLHRLQWHPCPQYRHIRLKVAKEVFPASSYCSALCKETPRTAKF